jgi:tetratricopeptide (TPR) repeat protein
VGFSVIAFPISKFSSYFFLAFASGLAIISLNEEGRIVHITFSKIKWILTILIMIGIITSYIRLNSEISYVKAIEYKNGRDYNHLVKELENVNSVLYPFDPSKQPIEYYRATGLYRLGKLNEALIHSIKSEKIAPNNPLVLHNTAAIYQSLKNYENAVIYYEHLHKIFPNYLGPQINLLTIYSETEQFEKGKELYDQLIKKDSLNPRLAPFKTKYSN